MNRFAISLINLIALAKMYNAGSIAIALATICLTTTVEAQNRLGIAATVNDQMISVLDIESRLSLSIYLSKLNNSPATRQRLAPQILRNIIDDRLKLQAIRQHKISISQAETIKGIRLWEVQSGLNKGDTTLIAKRLGIDKSIIMEQIETQLGWIKLIRKLFLPKISFSPEEIEDIVAEEISEQGNPEFLVYEIFLPINRNTNPMKVRELAERLIEQINGGAKFSAIARNFSQSATAAVGGSLGWIRKSSLPEELERTIEELKPIEVSKPIKTHEGIYIIKLVARRIIQPLIVRSKKPQSVVIEQIHFELPPSSKADLRESIRNKAKKISMQAKSCEEMRALGKKFGSSRSGSPGTIQINQLSPKIQNALKGLPEKKASAPLELSDGFLSVMLCRRDKAVNKKLSKAEFRDKVVNRLRSDRINLSARQYLRSLRRTAVLDIRL